VEGRTGLAVDVPTAQFREQLDALTETAKVVSLDEAVAVLASGSLPAVRLAVITFDDACLNFYEQALPILREYSLPSMLYVPVGYVNRTSGSPFKYLTEPLLEPMAWDQLAEVAHDGRTSIGSHTYSHLDLRELSVGQVESEFRDSKAELEQRLQVEVDSLCYPASLVTLQVKALAQRWYRTAVVGGGKVVRPGSWDPLMLPRVSMRKEMDGEAMVRLLNTSVWLEERGRHALRGLRGY